MATRKSGLGKSLQHMFGEDKIKADFIKNKESEQIKEQNTNTINENKEVIQNIKNENFNTLEENITDANHTVFVKTNLVQPNLSQPRKNFDEEKLQELAESISKYGILQPLIVKQVGAMYEIIAGERRWRAAKIAGLDSIPVQIKKYNNKTMKEVALIENIQRENLNAVEEALAYQSLIEDFGLTQEEVAGRVSKNRSTITNALRILKLNPNVLDMIRDGKLSQGHARALLAIEDEALREKIANKVIEENLSVRDIENLVKMNKVQKSRITNIDNESLKQQKIIIKDLEKKLKDKLNTKVKIVQKNENLGKIEIEYYTKDELDRLFLLFNSLN